MSKQQKHWHDNCIVIISKENLANWVMDCEKSITRKSKKEVRKKKDANKSMKKLSEQKLYIGPGPYFEKLPKG